MTAPGSDRGPTSARSGVRLAELVGTLSLAVDLGLGQPMEHVARSCLLATRLGEQVGLDDDERAAVYYIALLGWVGCIADSPEVEPWFGDDIAYRAGVFDIDMAPLPFLGYLLRSVTPELSAARRLGIRTTIAGTGARGVKASLRAHCHVTARIADRLGLGEAVSEPLAQIFARWDGKGLPAGLHGDRIARSIRLWQLCDVVEVHHRRSGVDAAVRVARERRGTQFDPALVDAFAANAVALFASLPDSSAWGDLIAAEPGLHPELSQEELDSALEVLADYSDLKAPGLRGHSRQVAELAAAAAHRLGLPDSEVRLIRRQRSCMISAGPVLPIRSSRKSDRSRKRSANASGCTPTSPSACSSIRRSCEGSARSRRRPTNGWTAPGTIGGSPRTPFPWQHESWRRPTSSAPSCNPGRERIPAQMPR